jgi:nucleoside-diphosphate-sugar epimerase
LKALVTGASGFIGSHIADRLIEAGIEVRCMMRKSSNNKWLDEKNADCVQADFDDKNSMIKVLKDVDYVFHSAGLNFAHNKGDFYNINTLGTKKLLNAVYESGADIKRFVYVSSQTASGPSNSLEEPVNEDSTRMPVTAYGLSKKLAEDEVISFGGRLPYTIIKPPAVFGPRDTAIFEIIKMMNFGFVAHMGLKDKYISLIHSDDLSRGIVDAAFSEIAVNQTYFLANSETYEWDYINDVFLRSLQKKYFLKVRVPDQLILTLGAINGFLFGLFNLQAKFDYDKAIDFTRKYWICSSEKAKNDLGFSHQIPFEDSVKSTIDWYKLNKWL